MKKHQQTKKSFAIVMALMLALIISFGLTASNVAYAYEVIGNNMSERHLPELSQQAWSTERFERLYPHPQDSNLDEIGEVFEVVATDAAAVQSGDSISFSHVDSPTNDQRQAVYTKDTFNVLQDSFKIALNVHFTEERDYIAGYDDPSKFDANTNEGKYGKYPVGLYEGMAFGFFNNQKNTVEASDLGGNSSEPHKMAVYGNNDGMGALKNSLIVELDSKLEGAQFKYEQITGRGLAYRIFPLDPTPGASNVSSTPAGIDNHAVNQTNADTSENLTYHNAYNHIALANPSNGLNVGGYKAIANGGANTLGKQSIHHWEDNSQYPIDMVDYETNAPITFGNNWRYSPVSLPNHLNRGLHGAGWAVDTSISYSKTGILHEHVQMNITWEVADKDSDGTDEYYLTYRFFTAPNAEKEMYEELNAIIEAAGGQPVDSTFQQYLTLDFWKSSERATKTVKFTKEEVKDIFAVSDDNAAVRFGIFSDNEGYELSLPKVYDYAVNFYEAKYQAEDLTAEVDNTVSMPRKFDFNKLPDRLDIFDVNRYVRSYPENYVYKDVAMPLHAAVLTDDGEYTKIEDNAFKTVTGRMIQGVYDFSDVLPGAHLSNDAGGEQAEAALGYHVEVPGYIFARVAEYNNPRQFTTYVNNYGWAYFYHEVYGDNFVSGPKAAYLQLRDSDFNDYTDAYYSLNYRGLAKRPFVDTYDSSKPISNTNTDIPQINYFYIRYIIPEDELPTDADKNDYVLVTIDSGEYGDISDGTAAKAYYVLKPNADTPASYAPNYQDVYNVFRGPGREFSVKPDDGFMREGWDLADFTTLVDMTQDTKVTAYNVPRIVEDGKEGPYIPTGFDANNYIKVTVDSAADGDVDDGTNDKVYYVHKDAGATYGEVIKNFNKDYAIDPNRSFKHVGWDKALGNPNGVAPTETTAEGFIDTTTGDKVITAQYLHDDIVPDDGLGNPDPTYYTKVTFVKGDHGEILPGQETIFYVKRPSKGGHYKLADLPVPMVDADTGFGHTGWDPALDTLITEADMVVTAQYSDEIIPKDSLDGPPNGYVTVTLSPDDGNFNPGQETVYYVKADAGKTIADVLTVAKNDGLEVFPPDGKKHDGWDKDNNLVITEDQVVIAQYQPLDDIVPESEWPTNTTSSALYVKVTLKSGDGSFNSGVDTVYYVRKAADKTIGDVLNVAKTKGLVVTPQQFEKHTGWDVDEATVIDKDWTVTAQYDPLADIIPEGDWPTGTTPGGVYVKVTLLPGEGGFTGGSEDVYYVRVSAEKTFADVMAVANNLLTVVDPTGKRHYGWDVSGDKKITGPLFATALYRGKDNDDDDDDDFTPGGGGGSTGGGTTTTVTTPVDVTVTETAYPIPAIFTKDHYAYVTGYPDGTVRPLANITRAEVSTIFFRLLIDQVRADNWTQDNNYSDVNIQLWFNNAVSVMSKMTKIMGYPDGEFKGNEPITRAELAAIISRFADTIGETQASSQLFSDTAAHWGELLIDKAAGIGWIKGYPDGSFRPDQNTTRAEFMAVVNRILHRAPENNAALHAGMTVWPDNMDSSAWYYLDVQEATNSHDFDKVEKLVPQFGFKYETWTQMVPNRDWTKLEKEWSKLTDNLQ